MLWRVTLAVAVVCVGVICNGVKADVMNRLVVPRDYGVKLCGREFIRAVIFTCGGSRWKRSTDGDLGKFKLAHFHSFVNWCMLLRQFKKNLEMLIHLLKFNGVRN